MIISRIDFICDQCNNKFFKNKTMYEALDEFRENFPKERAVFARMVCETCYNQHMQKMRLLQKNRVIHGSTTKGNKLGASPA